MDHVTEDDLAVFALEPDSLAPSRRRAIADHTGECAVCRSVVDAFLATEADLSDPDVWEASVAGSPTRDALLAYAETIAAENRRADELLAPILAAPTAAAWTNFASRKQYRTGGVVRRLSTHAYSICEENPLAALTFADAAVSIAEALPDNAYPANAIEELRGAAWKQRGNALLLLGRCNEALESLTRAERAYRKLRSPAFGLASVALARANALYQQQRLTDAAAAAQRAEYGFAHLGEDERRIKALYLRASIHFEASDPDGAIPLFQQVLDYGEAAHKATWVARASYALGDCNVARGNLSEASLQYHTALGILRETGPANARISTEWGLARILLQARRYADAVTRLQSVAADFEALGMITDAALVTLDTIEALLALGKSTQIVTLARHAFATVANAGMMRAALTAIAYIKDAAARGSLTYVDVSAARTFLRHLQREPDLLFAPPPPNSR